MTQANNKKYIYFVRHGESESNATGIRRGGESPLTAKGFKQAEFVGKRLARLPVDVILSSTYIRTKQTAETIQKFVPREIVYSDLLIERIHPSSSIGISTRDEGWRDALRELDNNYGNFDWRLEDAESGGDLVRRAKEALDLIIARPEQHIVVVTHGYFLRFMIARILTGDELSGEPFSLFLKTLRTNNTGISIVEYDETFDYDSPWALRAWNDHAHLADLVD